MSTRGFLIFAHNNEEVDYGKIALCSSLMIKANCKVNDVCLVTDQGTLDWLRKSMGDKLVDYAFQHVKIMSYDEVKTANAQRGFRDSASTVKNLSWLNSTRSSAYELSPFDETIMIDSDVLVQDSLFDLVWGNDEDVLINRDVVTLEHKKPNIHEVRLDGMGIPMYWATQVYFRKSERAKLLFDLVDHIKSRYSYFQYVYEFPGKLFRNDYAFSIAIHMLNGFLENNEFCSFPSPVILSSFDCDELIEVARDQLKFFVNDPTQNWKYGLNNVKGITVHCMNKYSILRQADKLISIYGPGVSNDGN
jgi:hypothetical protein